jgi:hypothetical protein
VQAGGEGQIAFENVTVESVGGPIRPGELQNTSG